MASAGCCDWGYSAPVVYAQSYGYGGYGRLAAAMAVVAAAAPDGWPPSIRAGCAGADRFVNGCGGSAGAAAGGRRRLRRRRLGRRLGWFGRWLYTWAFQHLPWLAALCRQSGSDYSRPRPDAALRDLFAGHGLRAGRQLSLCSGTIWPGSGRFCRHTIAWRLRPHYAYGGVYAHPRYYGGPYRGHCYRPRRLITAGLPVRAPSYMAKARACGTSFFRTDPAKWIRFSDKTTRQ